MNFKNARVWCVLGLVGLSAVFGVAAEQAVTLRPTARFDDARLGISIIEAEVEVPGEIGGALLKPAAGEAAVDAIGVSRSQEGAEDYYRLHIAGRRQTLLEQQRKVVERGGLLNDGRFVDALRVYAAKSGGRGPASWDEVAWLKAVGSMAYNPDGKEPAFPFEENSYADQQVRSVRTIVEGFAVIPGVPLDLSGSSSSYDMAAPAALPAEEIAATSAEEKTAEPLTVAPPALPAVEKRPFMVEVAPQVDDGLHWIVYNNLTMERVPVDQALLQKHRLALDRTQFIQLPSADAPAVEKSRFTVLARLLDPRAREIRLVAHLEDGREVPVVWTLKGVPAGERGLLTQWSLLRALNWSPYPGVPAHPFVPYWKTVHGNLYGQPVTGDGADDAGGRRRAREGLTLLSLFGSKAAVEETLQLGEELSVSDAVEAAGTEVSIGEVEGITVKAHPFAEMLAGKTPPALPIAELVPEDRALVYVAKPAEFFAGAPQAVEFLRRVSAVGSMSGALSASELVRRWGRELGLSPAEALRLIAGDAREFAVFFPDLNFGAGTEVTLLVRFAAPPKGDAGAPRVVMTDDGNEAWRAQRGEWSVYSTSEHELARVLALHAAKGAGSLGRSDEFRYMLSQLAPGADTRAYVYLSDPFIRQLVGPARLIGQWRQAREIQRMKELAAAIALRRLDVPGKKPAEVDLPQLVELGYVRPDFNLSGLAMTGDGVVQSNAWGTLARPLPLDRNVPQRVTAAEAEAYGRFKDSYTEYWRRFFDPIAVRFDAPAGKPLELETFILPLIDSQAYTMLRELLPPGTETRVLRGPVWAKPPVASLAFSLDEDGWSKVADGLASKMARWLSFLPPRLVDEFGPSVHVVLPDAAPVLQAGQGNLADAFAAQGVFGGRSTEMIAVPVAINLLTRPVVVAIELQDPVKAKRELARSSVPPRAPGDGGGFLRNGPVLWMAETGADERLLTVDLFGLLTMRYTLRIEGRWLLITNDPNAPKPLLADGETVRASSVASIRLEPGALKAGLATAHRAAMEAEARVGWARLAWYLPFLQGGAESLPAAIEENRRVLGYAPKLDRDALSENGLPGWAGFKRFGSPWSPKLPPLDPEKDFGVFEGVSAVEVSMQFEQDGLRSRVTWVGGHDGKVR